MFTEMMKKYAKSTKSADFWDDKSVIIHIIKYTSIAKGV